MFRNYFAKGSKVTFSYEIDSKQEFSYIGGVNTQPSVDFRFMIDDQTFEFDSQNLRELQTASVKIPSGYHSLKWQFSKYIDRNGTDYFTEIEIQSI